MGISADYVYLAYRNGEVSAAQIWRLVRFDLEKVERAREQKVKAMLNSQCTKSATGGAAKKSFPVGKTGRLCQMVGQEIFINEPGF